MKQPKLSDVRMDVKGTKRLRSELAKAKKIKITINIDEDSVDLLKRMSSKSGVPYQILLNQILRNGLKSKQASKTRLDRLEREIERLKERLVA